MAKAPGDCAPARPCLLQARLVPRPPGRQAEDVPISQQNGAVLRLKDRGPAGWPGYYVSFVHGLPGGSTRPLVRVRAAARVGRHVCLKRAKAQVPRATRDVPGESKNDCLDEQPASRGRTRCNGTQDEHTGLDSP